MRFTKIREGIGAPALVREEEVKSNPQNTFWFSVVNINLVPQLDPRNSNGVGCGFKNKLANQLAGKNEGEGVEAPIREVWRAKER